MRLGDHVDLLTGYPFKSAKFTTDGSGVRLLKGSVVSQADLDWKGAVGWPLDDCNSFAKFELKPGDVVVAMDRPWVEAGLKYAWVKLRDVPCLLVQRVARLRGLAELDTTFLRYVIGSPAFVNYIAPIVTGVNVPHISPTQILSFRFTLPPLAAQRKIAGILSAYDDLIENDNRRIQILEEMISRLYQQWFVAFRYPGHQGVRLDASQIGLLPSGWRVRRMDEVADVIDCLHSRKPAPNSSGTGLLLQLNNIGFGGLIDLSSRFLISPDDYKLWTSRIELHQGDCVITNVGRIAAVAQIPPTLVAAPGRNMTAVRPKLIPPTYLIQYLLSEHMEREVHLKKDSGSIMDALNVKGIVRLAVPVPPRAIATRFEGLARPLRREMENLAESTRVLRESRDLLLPRLVSGALDVSSLSMAMPPPAA